MRAAREDFTVFGNHYLQPRQRLADGPGAVAPRSVEGDDGARLGQAVALVDRDPGSAEEISQSAVERCASANHVLDVPADSLAPFRKDQLVGDFVLERGQPGRFFAEFELLGQANRPEAQGFLRSRQAFGTLQDAGVHFL